MRDPNKGSDAGTDPCSLAPIVELIDRLRVDCPWDRELSLADLRAYLIEEAHELAAAMDERDAGAIREELGDLLFEAVYVDRLAGAELEGSSSAPGAAASSPGSRGDSGGREDRDDDPPRGTGLGEAIRGVVDKMVARHPHVFGDEAERTKAASAAEVAAAWEQRKQRPGGERSALDGLPTSLPALVGAYRLGQKAAGLGFDWDSTEAVRAKVVEELGELDRETARERRGRTTEAKALIEEELGDILFAVANLARHLEVDPERALAAANRKFRRRFAAMEAELAPVEPGAADRDRMERAWNRIKQLEKQANPTAEPRSRHDRHTGRG